MKVIMNDAWVKCLTQGALDVSLTEVGSLTLVVSSLEAVNKSDNVNGWR